MGKKRQRGKLMSAAERERLRLRTDLVGQEGQHIVTLGDDNTRQLWGRKVPLLPQPLTPPPMWNTLANPNPTEVINPGTSPPLVNSPRLIPRVNLTTSHRNEMEPMIEAPIPTPRVKPALPPKPPHPKVDSGKQQQGISSEMGLDDYHHISEQLHRAAEKINKTKLSLVLQDKDKPTSCLTKSEESSVNDPHVYPYNDGEVLLKQVIPPAETNWDTPPVDEESTYLVPRDISSPIPETETLSVPNPKSSQPKKLPIPEKNPFLSIRLELNQIRNDLRNWKMVGTRMDGCYYSYDSGLLIDKAVIYHPLSEHFVQVEGSDIRIIAQMPIWLSQLVEFKKSPCYTCYDPLVETLSPDNEELV